MCVWGGGRGESRKQCFGDVLLNTGTFKPQYMYVKTAVLFYHVFCTGILDITDMAVQTICLAILAAIPEAAIVCLTVRCEN